MRPAGEEAAMEKVYLDAQGLLEDSFRLGAQIVASGFRPTLMIAIWRGGAPVGVAVQEFLAYRGIDTDHIAIRTSSYHGIDGRSTDIRIHGLGYLIKKVRHEDSLLIEATDYHALPLRLYRDVLNDLGIKLTEARGAERRPGRPSTYSAE